MPEQPMLPFEPGPAVAPRPQMVARVQLDTPIPHLDQPFDYSIPEGMDAVTPGVRVLVTVAGRRTPGFVTEIANHSDHPGSLRPIGKVVSPLPVLTPEILRLARDVAAHFAGSVSDVIRLAVPPRHAGAEARAEQSALPVTAAIHTPEDVAAWEHYQGGGALLTHIEEGTPVRAVWTALPGEAEGLPRWVGDLRGPVVAALRAGRRALVVVPTATEVGLVMSALEDLGALPYTADLPASRRYATFLAILAGRVPVVVGTRSAAFAPVPDLGLVTLWDPDDDNLTERRAPYPDALTIVGLRRGCTVLVGSYSRPLAAQQWVADGRAVALAAPRQVVRDAAPRVIAPGPEDLRGDSRRIPSAAFDAVRSALKQGPVLLHVPRAGYLRRVACAGCGAQIRCRHCEGPLDVDRAGGATCVWCGRRQQVSCERCGSQRLISRTVGAARTSEEVARAFPGVPIVQSGGHGNVVTEVDASPRIVVATPGAEPRAQGGYAAALLLDCFLATARAELAAAPQALDRWLTALSLVRPATEGGVALLLGDPEPTLAQACVRWDPAGWAERELDERALLRFPPVWRMAALDGAPRAVADAAKDLAERIECEVLGPVQIEEGNRMLARVPRAAGSALSAALGAEQRARSARKEEVVRVRIDPADL